ncbi:MAG: BBP7 family outer membrane beta-barrel protein [Planctomycetaceae bacterium]
MLRRMILCTVIAACTAGTSAVLAQGNPYSGEPGRSIPWNGNGMWEPYGGYPAMSTPYGSAPSPYSVDPPRRVPGGPPPIDAGLAPKHIYEYLPEGDLRGPLYETTEFERSIAGAIRNSWVRVDYLNWSLSDYDDQLLGSPYLNADATAPVNPLSGDTIFARNRDGTVRLDVAGDFPIVAQAQDLGRLLLDDRNGGRITFGMPTTSGSGTWEANVWSIEDYNGNFQVQPRAVGVVFDPVTGAPVSGVIVIPAIPLTVNGQRVDPLNSAFAPQILFDDFMAVSTNLELSGAEAIYRHRPVNHNAPLDIQFLAGFKYIRLAESINITGSDTLNVLNPTIIGQSSDYIFGPTVGASIEWSSKRLKFGIEERFTFGFDRHHNAVATFGLFPDNRDGSLFAEQGTGFTPVNQIAVYGAVNVTERLSLRVGYELLSMFGVNRAHENFVFDDSATINGPTRLRVDGDNRSTFNAHGFTISAELLLF